MACCCLSSPICLLEKVLCLPLSFHNDKLHLAIITQELRQSAGFLFESGPPDILSFLSTVAQRWHSGRRLITHCIHKEREKSHYALMRLHFLWVFGLSKLSPRVAQTCWSITLLWLAGGSESPSCLSHIDPLWLTAHKSEPSA